MVGALAAEAVMTPRLTLSYRTAIVPADQLTGVARHTGHGPRVPPDDRHAGARRGWPGWSTGSPTASPRRRCTPRTSTRTGPATRSWPSVSPRPCTRMCRLASPLKCDVRGGEEPISPRKRHNQRDGPHVPRRPRTGPGPDRLCGQRPRRRTPGLARCGAARQPRRHRQLPRRRRSAGRHRPAPRPPHRRGAADRRCRRGLRTHRAGRPWRRPVVVHPQFTEPDVALARPGHQPEHVLTDPRTGSSSTPRSSPRTPTWS